MNGKCFRLHLVLPLLLCFLLIGTANAGVVVFLNQGGDLAAVQDYTVSDPASALNLLVAGPSMVWGASNLTTAIPKGTKVMGLKIIGDDVTVDLSQDVLAGLDEIAVENIFKQINWTLRQFRLDRSVKITSNGKMLSDYLPAAPKIEPAASQTMYLEATATGPLSGKSVTLSPGHGLFWNGSGWYTQRPVYCSPLSQEDYHTLDLAQYLKTYLENDGMLVKMVRETDKSVGYHSTGNPWWKMASPYYLQLKGYPCTVYASYTGDCTLGTGASELNDDVRARPLASNLDGTDIFVSIHTNGVSGNCYGGTCPTGTETYYDLTSKEHKAYGIVSQNLANAVNPAIMSAITQNADPTWGCHGACTKDSAGNYGEIRIPARAAILTELAFHDSCDRDADINHLRDSFFCSAAMWGEYKGICDYFGVTPTWGLYSDEYVSDDIPAIMQPSEMRQVHITMRNKGVVWSEARAIRLGAVGDTDPFSSPTRYSIAGEAGPNGTYTFTLDFTAPSSAGDYTTDWQMVRDGFTWFGAVVSKTINVGGIVDTEAPSIPTGLSATAVSGTQVDLTWNASTDNVGVTGYNVYRGGVKVGSSATTSYSDTTCAQNTTYTYEVSAYDAAGNESAKSAPAVATTPGDTTPPVISNVASSPSRTSATVTWATNEGSTSQVEYGTTTSYGSLTTLNTSMATSHSVAISGLVRRTTYHYRVRSKDAANNEAISGDFTFTTL